MQRWCCDDVNWQVVSRLCSCRVECLLSSTCMDARHSELVSELVRESRRMRCGALLGKRDCEDEWSSNLVMPVCIRSVARPVASVDESEWAWCELTWVIDWQHEPVHFALVIVGNIVCYNACERAITIVKATITVPMTATAWGDR
jgi:hypothetical protein